MTGLSWREEVQLEERVGPDQDEPASVGRTPSRLMRWGREPLLHFLLIGVVLFVGYQALQPETTGRDVSNRIVLTQDDLRQLKATWLAQGRPSPTPEDMRRLIENKVHEEIFYREALALGSGQGRHHRQTPTGTEDGVSRRRPRCPSRSDN